MSKFLRNERNKFSSGRKIAKSKRFEEFSNGLECKWRYSDPDYQFSTKRGEKEQHPAKRSKQCDLMLIAK